VVPNLGLIQENGRIKSDTGTRGKVARNMIIYEITVLFLPRNHGITFVDFGLTASTASTEHLHSLRDVSIFTPSLALFFASPEQSSRAFSVSCPARRIRSLSPHLQWRLSSLLASVMAGDSNFVDNPFKFPSHRYSLMIAAVSGTVYDQSVASI
jgi:hypothetical protein